MRRMKIPVQDFVLKVCGGGGGGGWVYLRDTTVNDSKPSDMHKTH